MTFLEVLSIRSSAADDSYAGVRWVVLGLDRTA